MSKIIMRLKQLKLYNCVHITFIYLNSYKNMQITWIKSSYLKLILATNSYKLLELK